METRVKSWKEIRNMYEELREDRLSAVDDSDLKEVYQEIYKAIQDELPSLDLDKARQVWDYVFEDHHSDGFNDCLYYLNTLIELLHDIL